MSAINKALSGLAHKKGAPLSSIQRAHVEPIKARPILPWVVGSFTLSLTVGGWAVSQQPPFEPIEVSSTYQNIQPEQDSQAQLPSPTSKILAQSSSKIHLREPLAPEPVAIARSATQEVSPETTELKPTLMQPEPVVPVETTSVGEVSIEHVQLTAEELSIQAQNKAQKALDNNDLKHALELYNEALRYTPQDTKLRQTISALYYGKGEVRKSFELLQKGIGRDRDNIPLRLSLAKLLIKEQQQATALSVLTPLPMDANVEYLSLRGALAQKSNQDHIARTSYAKLVELEPESGRWWLGLAIQQERMLEFDNAKCSYSQALQGLGVSAQSQQFIRDRLKLIAQLEEQKGEN